MAKLNTSVKKNPIFTHEGAKAQHINPYQQLRRSVCSCMLWEREFYEDGEIIADRIAALIKEVDAEKVAELAIEARTKFKLRHVPLLLVRELARQGYKGTAKAIEQVIQRPDELTELLSIYWKEGKKPLSAQIKKGLAAAFPKFNAYQLAKYNRDEKIKLRDVLFLSHAKAKDIEQAEIWKRLIDGTLESPDTWEVALSARKDKKATWERLLSENKLGALALLRNLRNMKEASVTKSIIFTALNNAKIDRILPFRFISAAKYTPQWESQLEPIMLKCCAEKEKLSGKTVLVIDGSGSMFGTPISAKSEIDRFEAAAALAILVREICENVVVIVFSNDSFIVPSRRGFALRNAIYHKAQRGSTNTQFALEMANKEGYDRVVIITDEQSHQSITAPMGKGYVINVASARNGIGYGAWKHIDGFSEAVIDWIQEYEKL
jgi:60 kDa SS-A/Ro ribonucleoprotein